MRSLAFALFAALRRLVAAVVWPIEYLFRLIIAPDTLQVDENNRYGSIFDNSPTPVPEFLAPKDVREAPAAIAAAVDRHVDRVLVLADHHEWSGVDAALDALVGYISAARRWLAAASRGADAVDAVDAAAARLDALEGYLGGMRPHADEEEEEEAAAERERARRKRSAQHADAGDALTPGVMRKVLDRLHASMRAEGSKRARQGWGADAGDDVAAMVAHVQAERAACTRDEDDAPAAEDDGASAEGEPVDGPGLEPAAGVADDVGMRQRRRRRPGMAIRE